MRRPWLSELAMLGLTLTLAIIGGLLVGSMGWFLAAALGLVLGRHLLELWRLDHWLNRSRRRHPHQSWGAWGEALESIYQLQRRYYRRKKKLARVINEFRESTSAMPDGTIVLDDEWRIKWFNDAARRFLNLTPSRDIGQSILNLVRAPAFKQYVRSAQFDGPVNFASPVDDSRTLTARLIAYGSGQYLLLLRDVTRLLRLEAMRRDFVANASHELRSPITVLSGYLETLSEAPELGSEWALPLREMQAQCRRMTNLINDLLELSRLETDETEASEATEVEVARLLDRIVQYAAVEYAQQHHIETRIDPDLVLLGVENELHSAFSNLLINALRYTDPGGRIVVRWGLDETRAAYFEVEDEGIGIEEKHLPFITQRFYRVDSSHSRKIGGTGLGLAIVKHVLQRHGAKLEVRSEPGKGSIFTCRFPHQRSRKRAVTRVS